MCAFGRTSAHRRRSRASTSTSRRSAPTTSRPAEAQTSHGEVEPEGEGADREGDQHDDHGDPGGGRVAVPGSCRRRSRAGSFSSAHGRVPAGSPARAGGVSLAGRCGRVVAVAQRVPVRDRVGGRPSTGAIRVREYLRPDTGQRACGDGDDDARPGCSSRPEHDRDDRPGRRRRRESTSAATDVAPRDPGRHR